MVSFNLVGLSILVIFLLFILQKKGKRNSDYVLIVLVLLIAAYFALELWVSQTLTSVNFILRNIIVPFVFTAFLTYGNLLIDKDQKLKWQWWWFASFSFIYTAYTLIDFAFLSYYTPETLREEYYNPHIGYRIIYLSHDVFIVSSLIWLLRKLKDYTTALKQNFSHIEPMRLRWLRDFVLIYISIRLLNFLLFILFKLQLIEAVEFVRVPINVVFTLSLFYLCYKGIRQYTLAEYISGMKLPQTLLNTPAEKYSTSSLSSEEEARIFENTEAIFKETKLYLQPQLKISDVAEQLETTTHNISQAINSRLKRPFYDYVNEYRVEYFKELLADPANRKYTILALGIESGFNSKASMNRIFRQHTKQTPKEYQRAQLQAEAAH